MCEILLLDDDEFVLVTLAEALRDQGFVVQEACSAREVAAFLETGTVAQVLVTDVDLGHETDGYAVAAMVRRRYPSIKVIYITGLPKPDLSDSADAGAEVMVKPFLPSQLGSLARGMMGVSGR